MTCNGVLLLQIYRPCIKLWFHDTEWFFYPPKIMISGIDFFICHWDFRSDKHVIPSKFQVFFMRSSFIVTLIFPFVSFPFLSVVVKITYFAESPYSERFACEAFSSFAFSTSLLISYICFLASLGLKVTILFSVILNFLIFSVSVSLNLYSNSSTHSLIRYKFLFCY